MVVPGEYVENELRFEPKIRHVHCIGPTVIAEFNTMLEAIEAFEALEDPVTVVIGENEMQVNKCDIGVMPESEHMKL